MKSFLVQLHLLSLICLLCLIGSGFATAAAPATRGYSGTQVFSTLGADKDEGEPNHCGEPGGSSSWFFYQAPRDGMLVVDTQGSSFDTVLAVYTGPGTDFASLVYVSCNNDFSPTDTWSRVALTASAGTLYYIAVDGVGGVSGTVKLNYLLGDPLTLTAQPQSQVVPLGSSATFAVAGNVVSPLSYQWFHNQALLNGATQATLLLPGLQLAQEGAYSVMVSDLAGSLQSAPASLTVCSQVPPTNRVSSQKMTVGGQECYRVTGNAAAGSVVEASSDLRSWQPVHTNLQFQGLFSFDDPAVLPVRFYRIRLGP